MLDIFKEWFDRFGKTRIFPIILVYILLISVLVHRLFVLQIINGESMSQESEKKTFKERHLKGTRGNIYDCNGVLLAYNELSHSVTLEDSEELQTNAEKNQMIYNLIQILEKNDCKIDIDFEIQLNKKGEFEFSVDGTALLNFKRDVYCLKSATELSEKQMNADAAEVYKYLAGKSRNCFNISDEYKKEDALKIMAIRYQLFLNRYKVYLPITVASNIDEKTMIAVKENSANLPGVEVSTETYRKYNESKYFSHVIGYTGVVNEEELEKLGEEGKKDLYTEADQIGKTGIEKEYERYLHGDRGYEKFTVNQLGRVLEVTDTKKAASGNDIYLTIDSKLQKACYDLLEKKLANILLGKIHNSKSAGTKGRASDGIMIQN